MHRVSESTSFSDTKRDSNLITVKRLTAIWGFSEAAFGGILHAFKIPLTGLFIGGSAVILISLIAHFAEKKNEILKAAMIVILVKAVVSPHTPLNAYLAVSLQGLFGYLIFSAVPYPRIATLMLGFTALLFSALQKIIVLTLLFGNSLWESIDEFTNFIAREFHILNGYSGLSFSLLLIGIYTGVHLIGGIYAGIVAVRIPGWIEQKSGLFKSLKFDFENGEEFFRKDKEKKRKPWYRRKSGMIFLGSLLILMIVSYLFPALGKDRAYQILFMTVRAFLITFIWFFVFSPFAVKFIRNFLEKKKSSHAAELDYIVKLFPEFKRIISHSWKSSSDLKGISRFKNFLSTSFALLLFFNQD